MKIGRLAQLAFVLVWFYLFIALLANPAGTAANPVMPFLSASSIDVLWPVILLLTPILVVFVQRLIQPSGAARRAVTPQEFARIQARAHATSQSIREGIHAQEPPSVPRALMEAPTTTKPTKLVERPFPMLIGSEPSKTGPKEEISKSEFTPPPTTLREAVFGKAAEEAKLEEASGAEPVVEETVSETTDETPDVEKRIEELEAEKGAVSSLSARLEEMKSSGTIDQGLYEKLKKKYTGETEKIDSKIEKLARKEKKKVSNEN